MEPSPPWTAAVELRWRPCLDFYEQGVALLRHLDDASLLRRFRVGSHSVDADLADGSQLIVSVTGLTYGNPRGELDASAGTALVAAALERLNPTGVGLSVYFSHVEDLRDGTSSPEQAFERATFAWMPAAPTLGLNDVAVLTDGTSPGHGLKFKAEFGVVAADQLEMRLTGQYGNRVGAPRLTSHADDPRPQPRLALFVDSSWGPQDPAPDADVLTEWIMLQATRAAEDAAAMVSVLYTACMHDTGVGPGR